MHIGQWGQTVQLITMRQIMVVEDLRLALSQVSKGVICEFI